MIFYQLFDRETWTFTYVLGCDATKECILIDPVMEQAERDVKFLNELGLKLKYAIETHVHADHVTGGYMVCKAVEGAKQVFPQHSSIKIKDNVVLATEGQELTFGNESVKVLETPGHTDDSISLYWPKYKMVFTGDCLFIRGCGRTDFQNGNSQVMYNSIMNKLYALPDDTTVYPGHDYKGFDKSSIAQEKQFNPRIHGTQSMEAFVQIMSNLKLAAPKYINIAVPCNQMIGSKKPEECNK